MNMVEISEIYWEETLVKGQPAKREYVRIDGRNYLITRGLSTIVSLDDEWYEDCDDPELVVRALKSNPKIGADLFTFWQRIPDVKPKFDFHHEFESLAVLPITTYDNWFSKQISSRLRGQMRKALKQGVVLHETSYDNDFVRGMTEVFNEMPVRQGRTFWHYGKDFETVKSQFSRFIHREKMIAAYSGEEMIGFMMLGLAGSHALTGQIIGKLKHRDKVTNNLLIAKAVETCERLNLSHLVYLYWGEDGLAEFKRRCGFIETKVPRYFVPVSLRGSVTLKLGLHRGLKNRVPASVKSTLKQIRSRWLRSQMRKREEPSA
jgi:hypothetical protein